MHFIIFIFRTFFGSLVRLDSGDEGRQGRVSLIKLRIFLRARGLTDKSAIKRERKHIVNEDRLPGKSSVQAALQVVNVDLTVVSNQILVDRFLDRFGEAPRKNVTQLLLEEIFKIVEQNLRRFTKIAL